MQMEQFLFGQGSESSITNESTQEQKITLFRSLFRGREDVYLLFSPSMECPTSSDMNRSSTSLYFNRVITVGAWLALGVEYKGRT